MTTDRIVDTSHWKRLTRRMLEILWEQGIRRVILKSSDGAYSGDPYFAFNYLHANDIGFEIENFHYYRHREPIDIQADTWEKMLLGVNWPPKKGGQSWGDIEEEGQPATKEESLKVRDFVILADRRIGEIGLYSRAEWWNRKIKGAIWWASRKWWVAHYGALIPDLPRGVSSYDLHQFTESLSVPGIPSFLDENREPPKSDSIWLAEVTAYALNVRRGPGREFGVVRHLRSGELVPIYEELGSWVRIRPEGYPAEWVHSAYIRRI